MGERDIKVTTAPTVGSQAGEPLGIVAGEAVMGVNVFKDMFAGIRDILGGRSGGYQKSFREARGHAMDDMLDEAKDLGADAVVAIDVDYECISTERGAMLMVACSGTAVKL